LEFTVVPTGKTLVAGPLSCSLSASSLLPGGEVSFFSIDPQTKVVGSRAIFEIILAEQALSGFKFYVANFPPYVFFGPGEKPMAQIFNSSGVAIFQCFLNGYLIPAR
jgi:hypothetical protein